MAYNLGDRPRFMALFEDNDPKKRMLCIANYQNDLSEFWEFSETGRYLVPDSNEAYKVGVNQFIYGHHALEGRRSEGQMAEVDRALMRRDSRYASFMLRGHRGNAVQRNPSSWIRPRTLRLPTR